MTNTADLSPTSEPSTLDKVPTAEQPATARSSSLTFSDPFAMGPAADGPRRASDSSNETAVPLSKRDRRLWVFQTLR